MASKLVYRLFFLCFFLLLIFLTRRTAAALAPAGAFRATWVRFSALERRDGALPAGPGFAAFGLLSNGCPLSAAALPPSPAAPTATTEAEAEAAAAAATLHVRFAAPVEANGYFLVTGGGDPGADAVRWWVEGSTDNGSTWLPVGGSGWAITVPNSAVPFEYTAARFPTPTRRNHTLAVDHRDHLILRALPLLHNFKGCLSMAACFVFSVLGLGRHVRAALVTEYALNVALVFAAAALSRRNPFDWDAVAAWAGLATPAIVLWFAAFREEQFIVGSIVGGGITFCVVRLFQDYCRGTLSPAPYFASCAMSLATASLGLVAVSQRRRAEAQANAVILADWGRYERVWTGLRAHPNQLEALRCRVDALKAHLPLTEPRQCNRRHPPNAHRPCPPGRPGRSGSFKLRRTPSLTSVLDFGVGAPGTTDSSRPVDNLDQLYHQADTLHPLLIRKVMAWAAATGGAFSSPAHALAPAARFVRVDEGECPVAADDLVAAAAATGHVKWAEIKSVSRAVEKCMRSYKQDVSWLVDLCRQSIIFDSIDGIAACVAAVAADPDVHIVRVKNKLDPAFDSRLSAGYRDVSLNLRIVTDEAVRRGVDTHICEVQLIPRQIAEIKNDEGHKRYVTFRNLRAE